MNFLKYISIKNKLLLNVIIPIVTIIIMASLVIASHYRQKTQYAQFNTIVQLDASIAKLLHETQKERGATAGYLGSKGKKFAEKLQAQKELTNSAIKAIKAYL